MGRFAHIEGKSRMAVYSISASHFWEMLATSFSELLGMQVVCMPQTAEFVTDTPPAMEISNNGVNEG